MAAAEDALVEELKAQLAEVNREINALNRTDDASSVSDAFQLVSLQCRRWSIHAQIAEHGEKPEALAIADAKHRKWEEQRSRLAKSLQVDWLAECLRKIDEAVSRQGALEELR